MLSARFNDCNRINRVGGLRSVAWLFRVGVVIGASGRTEELRSLAPRAFIDTVLKDACAARVALCGFNFRFGKGAAGDGALLSRSLPDSVVLPPTLYQDAPVSASRIREALAHGSIADANAMLGRPYTVSGHVAHGKAMGRVLGFPTANISVSTLLPRYGVYKTCVTVDGVSYAGLSDVGVRPTVEGAGLPRIETFLRDFSGDLYGKTLSVSFLSFLREEKKFSSPQELTEQIARDLENI
jgi:riboflavin kinase/FMN adenylyltransferase